ncbi:hypothetical protein EIP86_001913 [Pleurotus ostreatoroseus]|nr:hypothetical protein EIP86_001913 [Pleurotus ostreatoroseus]
MESEKNGLVAYFGDLTDGAENTEFLWLTRHKTEFAADSKYPKAAKPTVQQKFLLKKVWSYQVRMTFKRKTAVDVDRECIYLLEQRMFEWSERAGIAGCQQWGPDAGAYQMRWNPYVGKPSEWSGNYEPSQEIDDWDKRNHENVARNRARALS